MMKYNSSLFPQVPGQRYPDKCHFRVDSDFFEEGSCIAPGGLKTIKKFVFSCCLDWPSLPALRKYDDVPF